MSIEITIDGQPADIATLDTFYRGIEALQKASDAAYETLTETPGATIPIATVDAFVAEHDRLARLMNDVYEVKAEVVTRRAFGVKA